MRFLHKNIRLAAENYLGQRCFFVTLCCEQRRPVFANGQAVYWLLDFLRAEAKTHGFAVHVFCVMPDHLHLLVEGLKPTSNLLAFVKGLKQKTAFHFRKEHDRQLWQKKFYDHILRRYDLADRVAWYIWMNPVRKGICVQPWDYPHSGSFTMEWKKTGRPEQAWSPPWKSTDNLQ